MSGTVGLRDFGRILREAIEPRAAQEPVQEIPKMLPPKKRKRARRVTLAGALKAAARAGRPVASAAVYADHVQLDFGEPISGETIDTPDALRRLI